jgi:hypothetical protein
VEAFMKSKWKEYPHLFANGKFKIKHQTNEILGYEAFYSRSNIIMASHPSIKLRDMPLPLIYCTLLARKIEDMTDEEIKWFVIKWHGQWNKPYIDDMRHHLPRWAERNHLEAYQFLQLISIGVYPFDQKDFENDDLEAI